MSANDLILLLLVAAGAFYAGYQIGRFKALAERGGARGADDSQPLPGPLDRPYSETNSAPSRPRAGPPPAASAGNDDQWGQGSDRSARSAPPRRSTKPPPASAGLMGTGEKPEK